LDRHNLANDNADHQSLYRQAEMYARDSPTVAEGIVRPVPFDSPHGEDSHARNSGCDPSGADAETA
jgi:hypothetical protein